MGTVVNGKVWDGACVNGKVVNGLVKNGVVFYKKDTTPSVLYKRRIMVGDNLNSKVLYITLPPDFVVDRSTSIVETDMLNEIIKTTQSGDTGTPNVDLVYISDFISVGLIGKTQYNMQSDFGTVTDIVDTDDAYRHLFIEDPNIRPIQVGDIITENTVFYFTFPDDLYKDETINWSSSVFDTTGSAGSIYMSMVNFGSDYTIYGYFGSYSMTTIYQYNNGLQSNVSYIVCGNAGIGQVSSINENLSKYILVDTTTLGA